MKDFTNNHFNVNEFAYKDEARIRHVSLKGLIIIFVIVFMIIGGIAEELDIDFSSSNEKYTIYEIEEMAEDALDEAEYMGYINRYSKEEYIKRALEKKGVEIEKYNITVDYYGGVDVEAK